MSLSFANALQGQPPTPTQDYSELGLEFLMGAHGRHATQVPASALLAPVAEQPPFKALTNKPLFVLSGSIDVGTVVPTDLWIAVFCGVEPSAKADTLDPLDLETAKHGLHKIPLYATKAKIRIPKYAANPEDLSKFDFKLLVPARKGLDPTIIFTRQEREGSKILAGTSTFVFIVLKTVLDGEVKTLVSGREAIIRHQYPVPTLEALMPATVRYPVKEIQASLTMAKYINLVPKGSFEGDHNVKEVLENDKVSLFIANWNPLIKILKAKCEWFEIIEELAADTAENTLADDTGATVAGPQPTQSATVTNSDHLKLKTGLGIIHSTRLVAMEEIQVSEIAAPELGGFQHYFDPPGFSKLHPTSVSSHFIVYHKVNVTLSFCRIDKDYDAFAMAVSFRSVIPRFRFLGTTEVAGPFLNELEFGGGKEDGEGEESVASASKKLFGLFAGGIARSRTSILSPNSVSSPANVVAQPQQQQQPTSLVSPRNVLARSFSLPFSTVPSASTTPSAATMSSGATAGSASMGFKVLGPFPNKISTGFKPRPTSSIASTLLEPISPRPEGSGPILGESTSG
ncbi:UNVERIFIED_CONTAM: hypothetical protein HDU68_011167, partial [Siphonaria sp. JEL0065]